MSIRSRSPVNLDFIIANIAKCRILQLTRPAPSLPRETTLNQPHVSRRQRRRNSIPPRLAVRMHPSTLSGRPRRSCEYKPAQTWNYGNANTDMQREWEGIRILTDVLIASHAFFRIYAYALLTAQLPPCRRSRPPWPRCVEYSSNQPICGFTLSTPDRPRSALALPWVFSLLCIYLGFVDLTSKATILTEKSKHRFAAIFP